MAGEWLKQFIFLFFAVDEQRVGGVTQTGFCLAALELESGSGDSCVRLSRFFPAGAMLFGHDLPKLGSTPVSVFTISYPSGP
jgi:hypothetical protein